MPYYEVLCLAQGRLARRDLSALTARTVRSIISLGGVVTRMQAVGSSGRGARPLAYTIRRAQVSHDTGFYLSVCAFASPAALAEVLRRLRLDEAVLRVLPVRKAATDAAAAPPDAARALGGTAVAEGDPSHALHQFLAEYEARFPDGQALDAAERGGGGALGGGQGGRRERAAGDSAVRNVIDNLEAATNARKSIDAAREASSLSGAGGGKQGLGWLLDLDEKKKET